MDIKLNNKKIFFENGILSELIVKCIIEKIIANTIVEINKKRILNLLPTIIINHVIKEINTATHQFFFCREIDPNAIKNNPQIYYDKCYIDNEPISECNIVQPKSAPMDRWKIYRAPITKIGHLTANQIVEIPSSLENGSRGKNIRLISKRILSQRKKEKEKENENESDKKAKKNQIIDLPSYPIEDLEKKKKYEFNGEIKKINNIDDFHEFNKYFLYQKELEKKLKEQELQKKMDLFHVMEKLKKPKKEYEQYKGKNINFDHNGEIILIKDINVEDLSEDFIGLKVKFAEKKKKINDNNSPPEISNNNNNYNYNNTNYRWIEKIKFNYRNEKEKEKGIILAGSSFQKIKPEIGVNIIEGRKIKRGGCDFYKKFRKHDMSSFNNSMINISKDSFYKNKLFDNTLNDSNDNAINSNSIMNGFEENMKSNPFLYKTKYRNISLPDIKTIGKTYNNRSKLRKAGNSLIDSDQRQRDEKLKYCNYIKASKLLRPVMFEKDNTVIKIKKKKELKSKSFMKTYYNKFIQIKNKFKNKYKNKYNDINSFNATIINDKKWGKDFIDKNSSTTFRNDYLNKNRFSTNDKLNKTFKLREKKKIIPKIKLNESNPIIDEKSNILKIINKIK